MAQKRQENKNQKKAKLPAKKKKSKSNLEKWIAKYVNWTKLIIALLLFIGLFAVCLTYLKLSSHTHWGTSILTSLTITGFFTLGFCFSSNVRCATAVFPAQLFSPVGITILFYSISWVIIIQPCFEDSLLLLREYENVSDTNITVNSTIKQNITTVEIAANKEVEKWIGTFQYIPLGAIVCLFIYSLCYVITGNLQGNSDKNPYKRRNDNDSTSIITKLQEFLWIVMLVIAIIFFTSAYWIWHEERQLMWIRHQLRQRNGQNKEPYEYGDYSLLFYYWGFCASLTIIAFFSVKLSNLRKRIHAKLLGLEPLYNRHNKKKKKQSVFFLKTASHSKKEEQTSTPEDPYKHKTSNKNYPISSSSDNDSDVSVPRKPTNRHYTSDDSSDTDQDIETGKRNHRRNMTNHRRRQASQPETKPRKETKNNRSSSLTDNGKLSAFKKDALNVPSFPTPNPNTEKIPETTPLPANATSTLPSPPTSHLRQEQVQIHLSEFPSTESSISSNSEFQNCKPYFMFKFQGSDPNFMYNTT